MYTLKMIGYGLNRYQIYQNYYNSVCEFRNDGGSFPKLLNYFFVELTNNLSDY
jgi:hypothetical protein